MMAPVVNCGSAALKVMFADRLMVSAPLPAAQPPVAVSVLAAVIASDKLQVAFTVIVAAEVDAARHSAPMATITAARK